MGRFSWRDLIPALGLLALIELSCAVAFASPQKAGAQGAEKWWPFGRSTFGFGAVFVDTNGSAEKYRTDYNYLPGFNLTEFSLDLLGEGSQTSWMDYLRVSGNGFGDSYPYEQAALSFGKRARYEFRGRYWKQNYFFSLPSYALGGCGEDSARRVTDLNLRLFPHPKVVLELGYFRNSNFGTAFNTDSRFQNLFQLRDPRRSLTQDFRVGVSFHQQSLRVSVFQNFRKFKDDPEQSDNRLVEPGTLPEMRSTSPLRLSVPSTSVLAQFSPSGRLSLEGKYTYSDGRVETGRTEFVALSLSEGLSLEEIVHATSSSDRPEHRAEVTASLRLNNWLLFRNTFAVRSFGIDGRSLQSTTFQGTAPGAGSISAETSLDSFLDYRLVRNRPVLEFFPHPRLSFFGGYQYADRVVETGPDHRQVTVTHTGFSGATWRPFAGSRFSLQFEKGTDNEAFTRTEPRQVTRWRFSSKLPLFRGLSVHPHFVVENRTNRSGGQNFNSELRQGGIELTYARPDDRFTLSAGYTLFDLNSLADIRFFLSRQVSQDFSRYRTHLHFFHSRAVFPVGSRLTFNLGFGFLRDPAGSSYPLTRDYGEAGARLRVSSHWNWELQWRHVSYNETLLDWQDYVANRLALTARWSY